MTRVYVGGLPANVRERDLEDIFYKFGRINRITIKTNAQPPLFAFVEFDDHRDAEDAVRRRDRYNFDGEVLRVELAHGRDRRATSTRAVRHSDHRVVITGLPRSASWQDLKDHFRKAGEICFADVNRDGTGIIEFEYKDDMKYALDKFNNSKFISHESEDTTITVREDDSRYSSGRGRSRSRSRSRSPARSRSPKRDY